MKVYETPQMPIGTTATQVFDTAQMRTKGTELEKFAKKQGRTGGGGRGGTSRGGGGGQAAPRGFDDTPVGRGGRAGGKKSSKWRQQSKQFRDALRQVRSCSSIAVVLPLQTCVSLV